MLRDLNLRIKPSTLPNAGLGLFSGPRPFHSGETVADYPGDYQDSEEGGEFAVQVRKRPPLQIDGAGTQSLGSYANDCRAAQERSGLCHINTRFIYNPRSKKLRLAVKDGMTIEPDSEIFVRYGEVSYWRPRELQAERYRELQEESRRARQAPPSAAVAPPAAPPPAVLSEPWRLAKKSGKVIAVRRAPLVSRSVQYALRQWKSRGADEDRIRRARAEGRPQPPSSQPVHSRAALHALRQHKARRAPKA